VNIRLSAESRAKGKRIFQLAINHGATPQRDSYRYMVLPNTTPEEVEQYVDGLGENRSIAILRNDEKLMAVQQRALNISQVAFYEVGEIAIPSTSDTPIQLSVNRPALVMLRETDEGFTLTVTDPNHSTEDATILVSVNQKLSGPNCRYDSDEGFSHLTFTHSTEEVYAGKPMMVAYRLHSNN